MPKMYAAARVRLDKVVRARKRAEVNYREQEQAARGLAVAARRVLPQRSGAPQRAHCVARRRRRAPERGRRRCHAAKYATVPAGRKR